MPQPTGFDRQPGCGQLLCDLRITPALDTQGAQLIGERCKHVRAGLAQFGRRLVLQLYQLLLELGVIEFCRNLMVLNSSGHHPLRARQPRVGVTFAAHALGNIMRPSVRQRLRLPRVSALPVRRLTRLRR